MLTNMDIPRQQAHDIGMSNPGDAADPFNAIDNFDFNPSFALTGLKRFCCRQPSIPRETRTDPFELIKLTIRNKQPI
jgi:hypothetical protein